VRDRELHQRVGLLPEAATEIRETLKGQNVALMFGSEKTGLSSDDLSHCNLLMNIATRAEHVSLNLAQAVAVSLYEVGRDETRIADVTDNGKATAGTLERITATLMETLSESGYVKGESGIATEQKVRRLVRRMRLNEEDAEVWLGMVRKILGRLRRGE
jgi:tRNA/rRNA methyltransferase